MCWTPKPILLNTVLPIVIYTSQLLQREKHSSSSWEQMVYSVLNSSTFSHFLAPSSSLPWDVDQSLTLRSVPSSDMNHILTQIIWIFCGSFPPFENVMKSPPKYCLYHNNITSMFNFREFMNLQETQLWLTITALDLSFSLSNPRCQWLRAHYFLILSFLYFINCD